MARWPYFERPLGTLPVRKWSFDFESRKQLVDSANPLYKHTLTANAVGCSISSGQDAFSYSMQLKNSRVETFLTISEFLSKFGREHEFRNQKDGFMRPLRLVAGGSGLEFEYRNTTINGNGILIRPTEGAAVIRHDVIYSKSDQLNRLIEDTYPVDDDHLVIRMMRQGTFHFRFGSRSVDLGPGDILTARYPPRDQFEVLCEPGASYQFVNLYLSWPLLSEIARSLSVPLSWEFNALEIADKAEDFFMYKKATPHFVNLINSFWDEPLEGELLTLLIRLKVTELLLRLYRSDESEGDKSLSAFSMADLRKLRDARGILDAEFRKPPTIDELAVRIGLNRRKLIEGFRSLFGTSVGEHCFERRMSLARDLLSQNIPLAEIANTCGYDHESSFSKAFKRKFGLSPQQWRNQL